MSIEKLFFEAIKGKINKDGKKITKKQAEIDLMGTYQGNLTSKLSAPSAVFILKALDYAGLKIVPKESKEAVVSEIIQLAKQLEKENNS